ncbi:MAG: hypothetical protein H6R26_2555, partial [Proteobacteria bacterium]|nr:hypothetical protein [Pseudomonadota bacterium]
MTTHSDDKPFLQVFFSGRMLTAFFMGFYGGVPL